VPPQRVGGRDTIQQDYRATQQSIHGATTDCFNVHTSCKSKFLRFPIFNLPNPECWMELAGSWRIQEKVLRWVVEGLEGLKSSGQERQRAGERVQGQVGRGKKGTNYGEGGGTNDTQNIVEEPTENMCTCPCTSTRLAGQLEMEMERFPNENSSDHRPFFVWSRPEPSQGWWWEVVGACGRHHPKQWNQVPIPWDMSTQLS
jgi:hypothetical protein